ncbi:MAG: FkbM family methyltransferase [Pseudomonadota bacterium]
MSKLAKKARKSVVKRIRSLRQTICHVLRPQCINHYGVRIPLDEDLLPPGMINWLYRGSFESEEATACKRIIGSGDRVLELGSCIGFISTLCAQRCGSDNVLSYEANPAMEPLIRSTHRRNNVSPELRMRAIGPIAGRSRFKVGDNLSASHLATETESEIIEVPCDSFEQVVGAFRPTVIVADIEGTEVDILPNTNLSTIRAVIVELHRSITGEGAIDNLIHALEAQGLLLAGRPRGGVAIFERRAALR